MAFPKTFVFSFQGMVPVLTVFQVSLAQQADYLAQFAGITTALFCPFDILLKLCCKSNLAHCYKPR